MSIAGVAALLILAAPPIGAPAAAAPVRVVWDAPQGCSDADAFYASLLARAEHARRAEPGEPAVRLDVKLTRVGPRVHGELRLAEDGRTELRKVDGATCDEVAQALSLTAALAIGASPRGAPAAASPPPAAATSTSVPSPAPPSGPAAVVPVVRSPVLAAPPAPEGPPTPAVEPSPPERSATPPTAPSPPAAAPEPAEPPAPPEPPSAASSEPARWRRELGIELGLGPVAGEVVSPRFSLGGTASLGLVDTRPEGVQPSATLAFVYLRTDLTGSSAPAVFRMTAATLTACPGWGLRGGFASVELCGLAMGGWLAAWDEGVTVRESVGRTWWSAGAALRGRAALGRGLSVQLEVSGSVPLVERRFVTTTPDETVGRSPIVAGVFGVSLVDRL